VIGLREIAGRKERLPHQGLGRQEEDHDDGEKEKKKKKKKRS